MWTDKNLQEKLKAGKIKGYSLGKPFKRRKYSGKEKAWIEQNLLFWANERALTMEKEYRFDPLRKYRFDFCLPSIKVAIEYQGIFSAKSGHTTVNGYSNDRDRINHAITLGWRVIELTAKTYTTLIEKLNLLYEHK